jgi:hypothetical protein
MSEFGTQEEVYETSPPQRSQNIPHHTPRGMEANREMCMNAVYKCSEGFYPWLVGGLVVMAIFLVVGIIAAAFTVTCINPDGTFNASVSVSFAQATYALIMLSLVVASLGFIGVVVVGSIWASWMDRAFYGEGGW